MERIGDRVREIYGHLLLVAFVAFVALWLSVLFLVVANQDFDCSGLWFFGMNGPST